MTSCLKSSFKYLCTSHVFSSMCFFVHILVDLINFVTLIYKISVKRIYIYWNALVGKKSLVFYLQYDLTCETRVYNLLMYQTRIFIFIKNMVKESNCVYSVFILCQYICIYSIVRKIFHSLEQLQSTGIKKYVTSINFEIKM